MSGSLITITQDQIFEALGDAITGFNLTAADGQLVPVYQGQNNLVPEPQPADYVLMWPLSADRLASNIDAYFDNSVIGSIAGNILTVTSVIAGGITLNLPLYVLGSLTTCVAGNQLTGTTGGIGTYQVTPSPDVTSQRIYCGLKTILVKTDYVIQLDVHGPKSSDNANRLSALFSDYVSHVPFAGLDMNPLYATSPRQVPFTNAEENYEERWIVELHLQINPATLVTSQFADNVIVNTVAVDLELPL